MSAESDPRPFSHQTRAENLDRLASEPFDLLVIGGGITGVAVARDAALRGFKTALVDKADWAAGTSSHSARVIHGGLRYLEYLQFHLVLEGVSERAIVRRIAPRLVRPMPFMFPLYRGQKPGYVRLAAALLIYDALAQFRNMSLHRMMSAREAAHIEPLVEREGLRGAGVYYDAVVDDARLTLATAQSAHRNGAVVANYVRVAGLMRAGDKTVGVLARDEITGRELEIRARVTVNACGPWVDRLRSMDHTAGSVAALLRPSKGVHLIVRHERLPIQHAIEFLSPRDGRYLYIIPWGNFTVIGTTDTDYGQDLDALTITPQDAAYLLEAVQHAFPSARLIESDIISAYAGLRPLIGTEVASTRATSREHHVEASQSGLLTIAGGKLTTHRLMARETVDVAAKRLGRAGVCITDRQPIETAQPVDETRNAMPADRRLVDTYGADAWHIMACIEEQRDLGRAITLELPYLYAEVDHAVRHEMALALADVLVRRTHVIYETPDAGLPQAPEVAALMAEQLGWDEREQARQVSEYRKHVALTRGFGSADTRDISP